MAFGLPKVASAADFIDRVQYDANSGRLFRVDFDPSTGNKARVDITSPPPSFAIDFGSLEVGYAHFDSKGPEFRLVPIGQPLPERPSDLDDNGKPKFRQAFRAKLYGKVLDGVRELTSTAQCVSDSIEDLYNKFCDAPEAMQGQVPVVTLTKTLPVTTGKGARQRTVYAPLFTVGNWVDRVDAMGPRTVPPPIATEPTPTITPAIVKLPHPGMKKTNQIDDDEIPF